jgi:hypothetical protein
MVEPHRFRRRRRLLSPPPGNDPTVPNRITGVFVRPNERVRWIWGRTLDNRSFVSGYILVPAWGRARRPDTGPFGERLGRRRRMGF